MKSIKALIDNKQMQLKKLEEDHAILENKKGDKYMELGQQITASEERLNEIKVSQQTEMRAYEDTEQLAVDQKNKRLHYERIRITEDRQELSQSQVECDKMEADIDEMVYEDTKDQ